MINYLVNFTLCSALLLLTYQLLLKNKAMYNFNRAYLLLAILFSLVIPVIAVTRTIAPLPSITEAPVQQLIADHIVLVPNKANTPVEMDNPVNYMLYSCCIIVYGIFTLLLLIRFIKNLYTIHASIKQNAITSYKTARLVLINENLTPHTFFNYIFLNGQAYHSGQIEQEVLQHELAHARQLHSVDIILIELIQVFCWFNPVLIFYRKAIQLNHEFIADAAVLNSNSDLRSYQNLLISKINGIKSLSITSQFNYSITKKRLIMMTKTTPTATAWFSRLAVIPVLAAAFMLFCSKTDAQQTAVTQAKSNSDLLDSKIKIDTTQAGTPEKWEPMVYPSTKDGVSETLMKEYKAIIAKYIPDNSVHAKMMLKITPEDKDRMITIFKQMSRKQQKQQLWGFVYPGEPLSPSAPTQAQFDSWKNAKIYGVWINGKRIKNTDLDKYKPRDFSQFLGSRLTKRAVINDGFHYQVDLMTVDYYNKYRRDAFLNRYNSMMYYHLPLFSPAKG